MIEPQVFHPLDLEKQMPALGRFLAHLPRAFTADYLAFDWGPFRRLPHLPAVRYRRSVLSPEQWRLTAGSLPAAHAELADWRRSLAAWRERTGCPATAQLHNGDLTLRLDLDEPLHALCLREHVDDDKPAVMTRAREPGDYGWIGGHAHEVALPLTRRGAPAPTGMPRAGLGLGCRIRPASAGRDSTWLSAKLFTAPDAMDEIIGAHLPALIATLGTDEVWFIRYRNREETDHLRVRIAAGHGQAAAAPPRWRPGPRSARPPAVRPRRPRHVLPGGRPLRRRRVHARGRGRVRRRLRRRHRTAPAAARDRSGGADRARHARYRRRFQRRPGAGHTVAGRAAPAPGRAADRATARSAATLARNGELSSFGTLPAGLATVGGTAPRPWRPTASRAEPSARRCNWSSMSPVHAPPEGAGMKACRIPSGRRK